MLLKKFLIIFLVLAATFGLIISQGFAYEQLDDNNGHGLHWLDAAIPVEYELNSSGTADTADGLAALRTSFTTWSSVSGTYLSFTDDGTTTSTDYGTNDGHNILGWPGTWSSGASTIALCTVWYSTTDGHILDADIAFNNTNFHWATDASADKMDVQNIATHEIGHFFGLADLYATADAEKTMYGYSNNGETKKRTLETDDENGVKAIYPETAPQISSFSLTDTSSGSTTVTDSRIVNFQITATNDPTQMMLSENSGFSGASWQTYAASGTFTLSDGYGNKTVYLKLQNASEVSAIASDTINYSSSSPPTLTSFSVTDASSGSSTYTNNRTVSVVLSASADVTQMILSENSNFSGASWQTYAASLTFQLSSGESSKTIYAKVRNGFDLESETKTATIILDTTAPVIAIKLDSAEVQASDMIKNNFTLSGVMTEANTIDTTNLKIYLDDIQVENGTDASGHFDNYNAATKTMTYALKSNLTAGAHSIKITAKDSAENEGTKELTGLRVSGGLELDNLVNFPNPFSSTTKLSFQLSEPADMAIKIFTTRGTFVKEITLAKAATQIGFNTIDWNGTDYTGNLLGNGAYLYLITASNENGQVSKKGKLAILR